MERTGAHQATRTAGAGQVADARSHQWHPPRGQSSLTPARPPRPIGHSPSEGRLCAPWPPPTRVDVYYYRPNPTQGKPGITVKHTVDLTTGRQVGDTEVLLNHHSPIAREELADAIKLAREKVPAVGELYQGRDPTAVRWE